MIEEMDEHDKTFVVLSTSVVNRIRGMARHRFWMCLQRKCTLIRSADNIYLTKQERDACKLNYIGYIRAVNYFETLNWIRVKRKAGKHLLITLNPNIPSIHGLVQYFISTNKEREMLRETWENPLVDI